MARSIRALVLALALTLPAPGCAAVVVTACEPQPMGGTRLLLAGPCPPDLAHGGALLCLVWLLDLPLTLAVDLACAPAIVAWQLLRDEPVEPPTSEPPPPPAAAPSVEPVAPDEVTAEAKVGAATSMAAGHRR